MAFYKNKSNQLLPLRQLNRKFDLDNKNVSRRKYFESKFDHKFIEDAEHFAIDFGRKSSIHGMSRIFQEESNKYERFFWFITFVSALIGSIYFCLILSQRYNAGSLQTVVESTNRPVFHVPFPEVTICNANHLNWDRLEEAKNLFLPNKNDSETVRMFELVIGLYDNLAYGKFKGFQVLLGEPIELVNNVNFSLVFDFMTWRCSEFLTNCRWHYFKMNCCEIFSKAKGEGGICWHFNTLSNEEGKRKQLIDNKYPWRTGSFGPKSALNVRVMINEDKHFRHNNKKGIMVTLKEPTVWDTLSYWVPANTGTMVEVEPVIYFYDNKTRILSTHKRNCLFDNENRNCDIRTLNGFLYMKSNCKSQCRQEQIIKYCNCTMDLLFPPAEYKSCKVKDLLCLAHYNDYFSFIHQPGEEEYVHNNHQGIVCKCFRNCYSINYVSVIRPSFLPLHVLGNKTYVDLDVHFRFDTMMVYRTSLIFHWMDLMVAFGGIAGLFLGCSLISVIELLYFALVEFPVFVYTELKNGDKLKCTKINKQLQKKLGFNSITPKWRNCHLNRIMALEGFQRDDFSICKNRPNQNNMKNKTLQFCSNMANKEKF